MTSASARIEILNEDLDDLNREMVQARELYDNAADGSQAKADAKASMEDLVRQRRGIEAEIDDILTKGE